MLLWCLVPGRCRFFDSLQCAQCSDISLCQQKNRIKNFLRGVLFGPVSGFKPVISKIDWIGCCVAFSFFSLVLLATGIGYWYISQNCVAIINIALIVHWKCVSSTSPNAHSSRSKWLYLLHKSAEIFNIQHDNTRKPCILKLGLLHFSSQNANLFLFSCLWIISLSVPEDTKWRNYVTFGMQITWQLF